MENKEYLADNQEDSNQNPKTTKPEWINEQNFSEILKLNLVNFKSLEKLSVTKATQKGDNYASNLYRIKVEVILDNDIRKTLSYILKLPLNAGESETIDGLWCLFPKEIAVYKDLLQHFEQLYREQGVAITFSPKYYNLPKLPGIDESAILLEDLSAMGFGLQNRLEGLNLKYTEKALQKLAEFHAASARYVEVYGPFSKMFDTHMFSEETRSLYEDTKVDFYYDYIKQYKGHEEYIELIPNLLDNFLDLSITASSIDPNEFNVLNHGDFWINNIMFQHDDEENLLDTYFIDYQLCKYGTPTMDLYMFLLSGTQLDIKLKYFDYFIRFYHENLVKNLKLLQYSGKIPSLKELHLYLYKYSYIAFASLFNCLSVCLAEPKTDAEANADYLLNDSPEAEECRKSVFLNERFKAHAEVILVWLARRGLLE